MSEARIEVFHPQLNGSLTTEAEQLFSEVIFNETPPLSADPNSIIFNYDEVFIVRDKNRSLPRIIAAGALYWENQFALNRNSAEVSVLATRPEAQGKGLGSLILKHLESVAATAGYEGTVLYPTTETYLFYQRRGYNLVPRSTGGCWAKTF